MLGFAEGSGPEADALYLRMDERAARIIVVPGDVDRIVTVGWEVRDHAALQRVKSALDAAGVPFKELSLAEADARRVEEVIAFDDPAGNSVEVFHGAVLDHSPVVTPFGARFVTGAQGLGHVVLPAVDFAGPVRLLHARHSVSCPAVRSGYRRHPSSGPLRVRFLGINERHHSLAICPAMTLRDPGLIHLMVEVDSLDAVGQALDRVEQGRLPAVVHARPAHQRQDGVVLRTRARRLGRRVRHRRHAGRRKPLHRRGNHRRQLLGPRVGRATCPRRCGHERRRTSTPGRPSRSATGTSKPTW